MSTNPGKKTSRQPNVVIDRPPAAHTKIPAYKPANGWKSATQFKAAVKKKWASLFPETIGPSREVLKSCWDEFLTVEQSVRYVEKYDAEARKPKPTPEQLKAARIPGASSKGA